MDLNELRTGKKIVPKKTAEVAAEVPATVTSAKNKKRGRPPLKGKRMTDTEYKRRYRAKKKAADAGNANT